MEQVNGSSIGACFLPKDYFRNHQRCDMINRELLISELEESTNRLVEQLLHFTDNNFNMRPAEDQWSAGEIAEHIVLLESNVNKALAQTTDSDRPADQKIEAMKKGMNNLERKYIAPEYIRPKPHPKKRDALIEGFKEQRLILQTIIRTKDLEQKTIFKHPVIGEMTGLEWVYFNMFHTKRHGTQLERLSAMFT